MTPITSPETTTLHALEPDEVPEVLALVGAASDADGADPLSEHALLRLRPEVSAPGLHLLARAPGGRLVGYAHVESADGDTSAELVVHPVYRRRGTGRDLVAAVLAAGATPPPDGAEPDGPHAAGRTVRVWAHGDHPAAAALALDLGFQRARVLWRLRRPLDGQVPEPALPAGVTLRAFRPGVDDAEWLEVNRRAFADHPEQGRWTAADLRARLAEPWFDPAGFLLAVDATGRIVGFHWTKVHGLAPAGAGPVAVAPAGTGAGTVGTGGGHGGPIGEVYVLGVDPGAHGSGLGRALTVAGLRYLADRGLHRVMLYVDESNAAAMALYTGLGFGRWTADVHYRRTR
jgi:mycothiol synthase